MQLVTPIGWQAAGWLGAMFLLSGLVVYLVTSVWGRLAESRMKQAVMQGLAPIAVGLTFSTVLALLHSADHPVPATLAAAGALYLILG
jgi:chromate transport protein ChrA